MLLHNNIESAAVYKCLNNLGPKYILDILKNINF